MTLLLLAARSATAADAPAAEPGAAGVLVPPKPTHRTMPRYPRYLPVRVDELNCVFTMTVDPTGRVTAVDTSQCYGSLGAPLAAGLQDWRFEPATLDGTPVEGTFDLHLKLLPGRRSMQSG